MHLGFAFIGTIRHRDMEMTVMKEEAKAHRFPGMGGTTATQGHTGQHQGVGEAGAGALALVSAEEAGPHRVSRCQECSWNRISAGGCLPGCLIPGLSMMRALPRKGVRLYLKSGLSGECLLSLRTS